MTNNGPDTAYSMRIAEDLSGLSGADYSSIDVSDGTLSGNVWRITILRGGESATWTFTTTFRDGYTGEKVNRASITASASSDPDTGNNAAMASVTISEPYAPTADLRITKIASAAEAFVGDPVTWTVTLTNAGPDRATNVTVREDTDDMAGVTILSAIPSSGLYQDQVWTIPALDAGQSATLSLRTNFTSPGSRTNRVQISSASPTDPEGGNNEAAATVAIMNRPQPPVVSPISAVVEIQPKVLDVNSATFNISIRLPASYSASWIDPASIQCGGVQATTGGVSGEDNTTYIARFSQKKLVGVSTGDSVLLGVTGRVNSSGTWVPFEGNDTVKLTSSSTSGGSGGSSGGSGGSGGSSGGSSGSSGSRASGGSGGGFGGAPVSKTAATPTPILIQTKLTPQNAQQGDSGTDTVQASAPPETGDSAGEERVPASTAAQNPPDILQQIIGSILGFLHSLFGWP